MNKRIDSLTRGALQGGTLFEELGFYYVGPVDGHDLSNLVPILENIRDRADDKPVLLHIKTEKGYGYPPAVAASDKYHGVPKFDVPTGYQYAGPKGRASYTSIFASALIEHAADDINVRCGAGRGVRACGLWRLDAGREGPGRARQPAVGRGARTTLTAARALSPPPQVVAITAAMPGGTGIDKFGKRLPPSAAPSARASPPPIPAHPPSRPPARPPARPLPPSRRQALPQAHLRRGHRRAARGHLRRRPRRRGPQALRRHLLDVPAARLRPGRARRCHSKAARPLHPRPRRARRQRRADAPRLLRPGLPRLPPRPRHHGALRRARAHAHARDRARARHAPVRHPLPARQRARPRGAARAAGLRHHRAAQQGRTRRASRASARAPALPTSRLRSASPPPGSNRRRCPSAAGAT